MEWAAAAHARILPNLPHEVHMTDDDLRAKVTKIALDHASYSGDELLGLLEYEWDRAGLAVADRGAASDFLRGVVTRVWRQAQQQHDSVEVIAAMAADSSLHWAAEYGWASDRYALVAGLIAAWVTRAILDTYRSRPATQPGPDWPSSRQRSSSAF